MTGNKFTALIILILLFPALPSFSEDDGLLNYSSGSYNKDIMINIRNIPEGVKVSYSFDPSVEIPDVPYKGGLLLTSLKGEERLYNLKISISGRIYNYEFLIDQKPPDLPEAEYRSEEDGSQGYYFKTNSSDSLIFYGYDEYRKGTVNAWKGELLSVPKSGFIYFYAEDSAGNRSRSGLLYQKAQTGLTRRTRLEIKSPVAGDFANPQLLYIEKAGYEWIKYSLNGQDPVTSGADYKDPVEIRRYGNVNLRIAAKPYNSSNIVRNEINYSVNTRVPLKNIPSSGVYSTVINIKSDYNGYKYCLEERSPIDNDRSFSEKLSINPIYGGVKYISFRLKDFSNTPEAEFRYFYVIDDRFPASPVININSSLPANKDVTVDIAGPEYSEIFYTTDGSTPGSASKVYDKPFVLRLPEDRNAGSFIIKARAVSLNNKSSEVVSKLVTYDTKAPQKPVVSIERSNEDGIFHLSYKLEEGEKLFYSLNGENLFFTEIDSDSFLLDLPEGMDKEFTFRFLAEDASGNRSDISETLIVRVDKKPPPAAAVIFEDNKLSINSDNKVEYSWKIMKNGVIQESETRAYSAPLDFSNKFPSGSVLNINVYTIDSYGNTDLSLYSFYLNEEISSAESYLFNSNDSNIYSGTSASFHAHPGGPGEKLFYYLTETSGSGEKSTTGPVETDGDIVVQGKAGETREYLLEVYSVKEGSAGQSKVSSRSFIIDNQMPSVPLIGGIEPDAISSAKITVYPVKDDDAKVYLVYAEEKDALPQVFSKSAIIFGNELVFDVKEGTRKDFYLQAGAEDPAGNQVVNEEVYHFIIDKRPPIPNLEIIKSEDRVIIKSDDEQPVKYYYERGLKGSIIREPDENSSYFSGELAINGKAGKNETVIVKIAAYDEAGNRSAYSDVFSINLNLKKPEVPSEPVTVLNKEDRKIFVYWEDAGSNEKIYYNLTENKDEDSKDYYEYKFPFSVKYAPESELITINYYSLDERDIKSEISTRLSWIPNVINTELVEGIKNNQYYNNNLQLKKLKDKKLIRYEIITDQIIPPEVTVFSPVLPENLEFKTEEGESIDFIVSLKEFQDNEDQTGGSEQVLRFTIDKQPPQPPEIDGIIDRQYYLSDQKAYFKGSEGTIYYKISEIGTAAKDEYQKFVDSFSISSPEGTYQSFLISSYSEDYAGNRSPEAKWTITIDKEIIYVSPDGQDYSDGTRSKPFRTINKAVEQVKKSKRKTIFISSGSYYINSPVIIDENITIYGGFNKSNWFEKQGDTIINVGDKFTETNPVFYVYGGNLNINHVKVNSADKIFDTIFFVNKGDLNINNTVISAECTGNENIIRQNYGNLYINNSEIYGKATNTPFISTDSGLVTVNNSVINVESGAGAENLCLVEVKNSINFTATGSDFLPGTGENITAVRMINSNVNLKSNTINSGTGSVSAIGVTAVNSKLKMNYCRITGNENNRITSGINSEDTILELRSNNFKLTGNNGIIGLKITGGNSLIYNNTIEASACTDFSYLFYFNGGSHAVESNIAKVESGDQTIFLRSREAAVDVFQNTILLSGGLQRLVGFSPEKNSVLRVINNLIINSPSANNIFNSLVNTTDDSKLSLKNNCLSGWARFMSGKSSADDLISLDLLDGIYSGGKYSSNIEETLNKSFAGSEDYHLGPDSACIDSGYDLSGIIKESLDIDGEKRPNPLLNRVPAFDIGADEYYE